MNELVSAVPWLGKRNPMAARWLIIIIALVAPLIAWQFGRSWVRILDFALLYMMLALGLNLVVGFAGLLDLGYIAFYAVGAYAFAFLASPHFDVHMPFWIVLPLAAGFAALAGIMLGFPVLRLRGDYLAIVTLGFGEIVRIFLLNLNYPINITNGPQGITLIDPVTIGGLKFSGNTQLFGLTLSGPMKYYYLLVALAILVIIINLRLQHSRIGRAWQAIREDEIAAKAVGINTRNIKLLAFAMGASFGGIAGGVFAAMQGFVSPESFSLMESIMILAMVVLGGMGHIPGVILGAVLLSILPEVLRYGVGPAQMALFGKMLVDPESLRMLVFGLALVLVMRFKPAGLWPSPERKRELSEAAK